MFDPQDTIRLELDFGRSSQEAAEVSQSLKTVETTTAQATNAFKQIKTETDALEQELVQLNKQFREGKVDLETYTLRAESLRAAIAEGNKLLGGATSEVKNFGTGLMNISFAVQDFTSQLGTRGIAGGLAAIQNNIPGILVGLGVGPGLAGVASIASLAVGGLVTALSGAEEKTKNLKSMLDTIRGLAPPGELEREKGITEFLKQQGGGRFEEGLWQAIRAENIMPGQNFAPGEEARFNRDIQKRVESLMSRLGTSRQARDETLRLAREHPGLFGGPQFAERLAESFAGGENMPRLAAEEAQAEAEGGAAFRAEQMAAQRGERAGEEAMRQDQEHRVRQLRQDAQQRQRDDQQRAAGLRRAKAGVPGILNQADRAMERAREVQQRVAIEGEINARSGGQAPIKDIQEAGRRTLDLVSRGVNLNDAIMQAMHEQGQKMMELQAKMTGQEQFLRQMKQQRQHAETQMGRAW